MKKHLLLLLLLPFMVTAQYTSTYYYDFNSPTNGTGTIDKPFNAWSNTHLSSNRQFLWKRGTEFSSGSQILITGNKHDIRFGSYGTGIRPIYRKTATGDVIKIQGCQNIVIEGIHITAAANVGDQGISCFPDATYVTKNITINDCEISNRWAGIYCLVNNPPPEGMWHTITITNNLIHDHGSDGIIIAHMDNVVIDGNHVYNVNKMALAPVPKYINGDCVHLIGNTNPFKVSNNILDKSNTGGKFCFIYGAGSMTRPVTGEVTDNIMIAPDRETITMTDGSKQTGQVLYCQDKTTSKITITYERNTFTGRKTQYSKPGYQPAHIGHVFPNGTVLFRNNIIDSLNVASSYADIKAGTYLDFSNNTIVSSVDGPAGTYLVKITGAANRTVNNNIAIGKRTTIQGVNGSNNLIFDNQSSTANWNNLASIESWQTGNYHRNADMNDGFWYEGIVSNDFDNVQRSNPPEAGAFEFTGGSPPGCNQPTITSLNHSPAAPLENQAVTFSAVMVSNCPVTYLWTFQNNGTSMAANPVKTWPAAGTYSYSLAVTSDGGTATKSGAVVISPVVVNPCDTVYIEVPVYIHDTVWFTPQGVKIIFETFEVINDELIIKIK